MVMLVPPDCGPLLGVAGGSLIDGIWRKIGEGCTVVYTYISTYMYIHTLYIHTYIHTNIHTYIYLLYIHTYIHCTYIRIVYLVREPFLRNGGVSMVIKLNGDAIGDKTGDFCLSPTLDAGEGRMCRCEGGRESTNCPIFCWPAAKILK